jgi:hypothetical protein
MVWLVLETFNTAQSNYIKYGMDSEGHFCGLTDGFVEYPYAYYTNISNTNWFPFAVCV